jgi:glutathione peroxidase-family protein
MQSLTRRKITLAEMRAAAMGLANAVPRRNFHKYLVGRDGYIADAFPKNRRTAGHTAKDGDCAALRRNLTQRVKTSA